MRTREESDGNSLKAPSCFHHLSPYAHFGLRRTGTQLANPLSVRSQRSGLLLEELLARCRDRIRSQYMIPLAINITRPAVIIHVQNPDFSTPSQQRYQTRNPRQKLKKVGITSSGNVPRWRSFTTNSTGR
ncbi:hypothetical protein ETA_19420 [Erwinia tasmaniensis Et1/99]|uniref:Uncharacterized protein n=1 Tax=Erwinia tasmaniensis (strain DSM 17950 / CFBP 7177 / CIP 109463 / NCPPB 4357 / Et1/99) TaxID=465817 RepID=B2VDS3_ERWT9|nr:hypothetical protein ETA_19420 [Erwinia tasmaniensis Et1/99]